MYSVTIGQEKLNVEKKEEGFRVDGVLLDLDIHQINDRTFHVIHENRSYTLELIEIDHQEKRLELRINNKSTVLSIQDKFDILLDKLGMKLPDQSMVKDIKAPMPGLIFDIKVKVGDQVRQGDAVLILEAMKMENILKSPGDGIVKEIKVKQGQSVEKNQVLIQF
ncbi:acetyl-CoA carboxylase biotin carboxyl carrier protein subunit [Pararhodonellum marinum]|uniref:acetyl-CoA carboxylase biotin carboxyl carrier protein subunit n=1 Tax=Pararhodonellum marinum TaxID=2755358 RepID=UPI00188E71BD|nr:acetyl-CoA carboxylase biotin carboxyl carrier protein subunit [Pararhodonellum marinum]